MPRCGFFDFSSAHGRREAATGSFITLCLSDEVKTAINSVAYSIGRSCAVLNCAPQSLYEKMLPVQDRASCLPESSRRALVADAWEIRQHQMHSLLTPVKRVGHWDVRQPTSHFRPAISRTGQRKIG